MARVEKHAVAGLGLGEIRALSIALTSSAVTMPGLLVSRGMGSGFTPLYLGASRRIARQT